MNSGMNIANVPSEIQWTSFFFFKISLVISFRTKIILYTIYHRLIYNCTLDIKDWKISLESLVK